MHKTKKMKRMQVGGKVMDPRFAAAAAANPANRGAGRMVRPGFPSGPSRPIRPMLSRPIRPVTAQPATPSRSSTKMTPPPQTPTTQAPPPKSQRERYGLPAEPSGLTRTQEAAIVQEKINQQEAQPRFELNRPTTTTGLSESSENFGLFGGGSPTPDSNGYYTGQAYLPPATVKPAFRKGGVVKSKAMRGGGLARKGVGMALAKGGLARRAGGCAKRGVGKGKMV